MGNNKLQTQCQVHLLIDIPLSAPTQHITNKITAVIRQYSQDDKIVIQYLDDNVDSGIDEGTRKILAEFDSFNNSHMNLHKVLWDMVSEHDGIISMTAFMPQPYVMQHYTDGDMEMYSPQTIDHDYLSLFMSLDNMFHINSQTKKVTNWIRQHVLDFDFYLHPAENLREWNFDDEIEQYTYSDSMKIQNLYFDVSVDWLHVNTDRLLADLSAKGVSLTLNDNMDHYDHMQQIIRAYWDLDGIIGILNMDFGTKTLGAFQLIDKETGEFAVCISNPSHKSYYQKLFYDCGDGIQLEIAGQDYSPTYDYYNISDDTDTIKSQIHSSIDTKVDEVLSGQYRACVLFALKQRLYQYCCQQYDTYLASK